MAATHESNVEAVRLRAVGMAAEGADKARSRSQLIRIPRKLLQVLRTGIVYIIKSAISRMAW
jgi:hypothetical protein